MSEKEKSARDKAIEKAQEKEKMVTKKPALSKAEIFKASLPKK